MSFTLRVIVGLVAGLLLGIALSAVKAPWASTVVGAIEPIGVVFTNAIRMTVIPLVVASLIAGVAAIGDAKTIGRLGGRSLLFFVVFVSVATLFGAATGFPLLGLLHIEPGVATALRESAAGSGQAVLEGTRQIPSAGEWVVGLVPVNVFKSANDGAILPLIVFALGTGLALTSIAADRRQAVLAVVRGLADAMLVLVGWVLKLTPIGVFALAMPLGVRMGVAAAGALAYYILVLSLVSAAFIGLLYPVAVVFGRVPVARFAKASAPGQAVAFASRSSLAALPACIEGVRTELKLGEEIAGFFLPFAASMFRVGGAIAQVVSALFLARLYGVELSLPQLATIVVAVVPTSFTIPGIPGGAIITMAPVLVSVGLPAEGIGILLGVDTISDMFRTGANVTGWMAVAVILGRGRGSGTGDRGSGIGERDQEFVRTQAPHSGEGRP